MVDRRRAVTSQEMNNGALHTIAEVLKLFQG